MVRENFYTGEPISTGSPFTSEQEAEMNAAIGQLYYSGMQQPQYGGVYPGGYGYNPQPQQMQPYQMAANNPYISNPIIAATINSQQYQQQQFVNPNNRQPVVQGYYVGQQQPGIGYGIPGTSNGYSPATFGGDGGFINPFYNNGQQAPMYQAPNEEYKVFIEPIRMNGEYMPFLDQEDRFNEICKREYNRMIESDDLGYYGGNFGTNYYGSPFSYSRSSTQFERDMNELSRKCRDNRKAFDMRISKMAHSFQNDGVTDEDIEKMYNGYVLNTGLRAASHSRRIAMGQMYTVDDNHEDYAKADAQITANFYKIIGVDPEHCDMNTFFDNIGAYGFAMQMEEERKKRVHTRQYNMSTYSWILKQKAMQKNSQLYGNQNVQFGMLNQYNHNPGFINPALEMMGQQSQSVMQQQQVVDKQQIVQDLSRFPTLSRATISDDGTININYGYDDIYKIARSYDNDQAANDNNPIINQYENQYQEERQAFADSIYAEKNLSQRYTPPKPKPKDRGGGG